MSWSSRRLFTKDRARSRCLWESDRRSAMKAREERRLAARDMEGAEGEEKRLGMCVAKHQRLGF